MTLLNLIDESTRECLLIRAERRWSSAKVIGALADVMVWKGVPEHLRSDNGPEFVAKDLRKWLADTGAKTLYIEPGSPWENGYCESFNSKLRDEFLNGELFYSMKELRVLAERWRVHYNTVRPHSSLGYRPPAPAWLTSTSWQHGDDRGRPWHDTRSLLNGVFWVLGIGAQWRELPEKYPQFQTCHRRFPAVDSQREAGGGAEASGAASV
jgi:hypothetical protein